MRGILTWVVIGLTCACSNPNVTGAVPTTPGTGAWTDPEKAASKTVLLVGGSENNLYIVAYPSGKPLHTLTGFDEPQGTCSDGNGHFWIANTGNADVIEYSSDGANLGTVSDANNYPVGCAYDPKTGDLAVANIITTSDGPGNVAIYSKAKGSPKIYTAASLQKIYFAAFAGSSGTLVVDGENSSSDVAIASFNGGKFHEITLKGETIEFPGALAWSTKLRSMNIGDQDSSAIYHFDLDGKVTGTTTTEAPGMYVVFGGTLLSAATDGLEVYDYPAGGSPKRLIPLQSFGGGAPAVSSAVTE
jgi:sugar lactone lactonase YvrE